MAFSGSVEYFSWRCYSDQFNQLHCVPLAWFPRLSTLLCSLLRMQLERLEYAFMWMHVQIEMITGTLNGLPYRYMFLFEIYLTML